MGRKRTTDPKLYFLASEQIYCANVAGRRLRLGPDKAEAERRRQTAVGEWLLRGRSPRPAGGVTVADLTTAYLRHCSDRHAAGGLDSRQFERIAVAANVVVRMYGPDRADGFGPLKLQAVRDELLRTAGGRPPHQPLSRRYVNHLVGCLKTCWGWGARRELVPGGLVHGLREVKSLRRREGGREVPPRLPVSPEVVAATLPHLPPTVAAMVRLQRLSGCRPQDVCRLRPRMVSRTAGQVLYPLPELPVSAFTDPASGVWLWVYAPEEHKGSWREKPRIIVFGPQAQAVLTPYLDGRDPDCCCFSPRESMDALRASQGRRAKYGKGREPNGHYTTQSYGKAIAKAARRAGVQHWCAHALRRDAGTAAANLADEHVAAAVLGDHPDLMRTYVRSTIGKAGGYAAEHG
jgi:integrase